MDRWAVRECPDGAPGGRALPFIEFNSPKAKERWYDLVQFLSVEVARRFTGETSSPATPITCHACTWDKALGDWYYT